jgi:RNA polymerase sigma-70 factor (TIGR02957 family)
MQLADTEAPDSTETSDDGLAAFVSARPRLMGIAYRMLSSVAEAEDIVQDVWLRWQSTDRSTVHDSTGFLVTVAMRLAINRVKSVKVRREAYIGTWLPEPVDTSTDPAFGAERAEALELAVLMLLERLSPTERAAYVLREAFNYEYARIAEIIRVSEVNCRQLLTRARKHVAEGRGASVGPVEQRRLLEAFVHAAQKGDVAALEALFSADVISYSDGGGVVRAARRPVEGRARVATALASFASFYWTGVALGWGEANGQPSLVVSRGGTVVGVLAIGASNRGIERLLWLMRPSKLGAVVRPFAQL